MNIQFKLTSLAIKLKEERGIDVTPRRGSKHAAGFDIFSCLEDTISIYPGQVVKVPSGVHIYLGETPEGYPEVVLAGFCLPRSSIKGLMLDNTVGLLDQDYQGEWICKLFNKTEEVIYVNPGEKLTQMVVALAIIEPWTQVQEFDTTTDRGENGFGSTGK